MVITGQYVFGLIKRTWQNWHKFQNDLNVLCGYFGDEIDIVFPTVGENSNLTSYGGAHDDDTASTGSASLPSLDASNDYTASTASASLPSLKAYHDIVTHNFWNAKTIKYIHWCI